MRNKRNKKNAQNKVVNYVGMLKDLYFFLEIYILRNVLYIYLNKVQNT